MGKILKIIFVLLLLTVCLKFFGSAVDRGLYQLLHQEKVITAPKDKTNCLKKGGTWGAWGLFPNEFCQIPFADGGKSCFSGFMCGSGKCIRGYNFRDALPVGVGQCTKYPSTFGCTQEINFGVAGSAICRD